MDSFTHLKSCLLAFFVLLSFASAAALPKSSSPKVFNFILTKEAGNPDGSGSRDIFKINGQFPGPAISATEGDEIEVYFDNQSGVNSTLHFHGIEQIGTPWSDGTPGLSQWDTQTGCSFRYKFTANKCGSFWYHSHVPGQFADGLAGAFTVHPKASTITPYKLISNDSTTLRAIARAEKDRVPLLLADWRNWTSEQDWSMSEASQVEILCANSLLVNGKGRVNCLGSSKLNSLASPDQKQLLGNLTLTDKGCMPASILAQAFSVDPANTHVDMIPDWVYSGCKATETPEEIIKVHQKKDCEAEKWVMLDIIGGMSEATVMLSIDEREFYVVAADGNDMEPVKVNALPITNGQRYTILCQLSEPKKYTVRVASITAFQIINANFFIDFTKEGQAQGAQTTDAYIDESGKPVDSSVVVLDPSMLINYPAQPVPEADATYVVHMGEDRSEISWAFNETSRPAYLDDATPLLFNPQPQLNDNHTITIPSDKEWVDFIMVVKPGNPPHPIHFHGKHFQVLGQGEGKFTWNSVAEAAVANPSGFNLANPTMRDSYVTPGSIGAKDNTAWLAVRRPSSNPGVWLIHCHIESHLRGGMSMVIQDGTDNLPKVPSQYSEHTCRA